MSKPNNKIYHVVAMVALILKDEEGADFRIEAGATAKLSEAQYKTASAYVEVKKVEGDEPPATVTDDEPKADDATQTPDSTAPPAEPIAEQSTEPVKTTTQAATKTKAKA